MKPIRVTLSTEQLEDLRDISPFEGDFRIAYEVIEDITEQARNILKRRKEDYKL